MALTTLARHAPGLAPAPLEQHHDPTAPSVVMSRVPGEPLGARPLTDDQLDALANGDVTPIPQPRDGVSLAPKIQVDDVRLDFSVPAFAVDRRIRGASPAPGGWAMLRGERVKLLRSRLADADGCPPLTPGELHATKKQVFAGALGGVVELLEVQPHGKKVMRAADWARGIRVEPGARFGD